MIVERNLVFPWVTEELRGTEGSEKKKKKNRGLSENKQIKQVQHVRRNMTPTMFSSLSSES